MVKKNVKGTLSQKKKIKDLFEKFARPSASSLAFLSFPFFPRKRHLFALDTTAYVSVTEPKKIKRKDLHGDHKGTQYCKWPPKLISSKSITLAQRKDRNKKGTSRKMPLSEHKVVNADDIWRLCAHPPTHGYERNNGIINVLMKGESSCHGWRHADISSSGSRWRPHPAATSCVKHGADGGLYKTDAARELNRNQWFTYLLKRTQGGDNAGQSIWATSGTQDRVPEI